MKIKRTAISLFVVPPEIITEEAQTNPSSVSIPVGLLPHIICRNDSNHKPILVELMEWFRQNLQEKDGYIPASAALPALSLDDSIYAEAIDLLRAAISEYGKVQGPVFIKQGVGRDALFNVADFYNKMLHGSTLAPVVSFKQTVTKMSTTVPELGTIDPDTVMPDNHIVSEDPALEEPCQ